MLRNKKRYFEERRRKEIVLSETSVDKSEEMKDNENVDFEDWYDKFKVEQSVLQSEILSHHLIVENQRKSNETFCEPCSVQEEQLPPETIEEKLDCSMN